MVFTSTNDYKIDYTKGNWFDCTCEITCKCGSTIILNAEDDPIACECGRVWRLSAEVLLETNEVINDTQVV